MVHNSYDHRVQQTSIRKVLFLGLVCKVRHLELSGVTHAQYVIELLVSGVAHGTKIKCHFKMAEKHSEKGERSFLARTASITSKRARRAQEKVDESSHLLFFRKFNACCFLCGDRHNVHSALGCCSLQHYRLRRLGPFTFFFKVKQKLGKANETKDLTFDEFVNNFNKQQVRERMIFSNVHWKLRSNSPNDQRLGFVIFNNLIIWTKLTAHILADAKPDVVFAEKYDWLE